MLDAAGCVVAPGFVDLHSHAQTVSGHRLQAFDGVTTALDLEAGRASVTVAYADAGAEGRPLNYGFSASWAHNRMAVLAGVARDGTLGTTLHHLGGDLWQREATAREQAQLLELLRDDLAGGALGIGVLVGYNPATGPDEYLRVAALAKEVERPAFTHARDLVDFHPAALVDGAEEVVRAAAETGAHMHYCHTNSTSLRAIDRVLDLVDRVRAEGATVTTEGYPYGAGSTSIGAAFLAPERLPERGLSPRDLVVVATGERVADAHRLEELRRDEPGALCIVHFFDENRPEDVAVLLRSLEHPDACIASDAMPLTWAVTPRDDTWPLPAGATTHPRTCGTFARSYRRLVVERGVDVVQLVRQASALPAAVLSAATGGKVRKGSLSVGADADVVVFDPAAFCDRATYEASTTPSTGVRHLLVNGQRLIRDGELDVGARPGRALRA